MLWATTLHPSAVLECPLHVAVKSKLELKINILVSAKQFRVEVLCKRFLCLSGLHMEVINSLSIEMAS